MPKPTFPWWTFVSSCLKTIGIVLMFSVGARGERIWCVRETPEQIAVLEDSVILQLWHPPYKLERVADSLWPTFSDIDYFIVLPYTIEVQWRKK